jgi:hypothetical protein
MRLSNKKAGRWKDVFEYQAVWSMAGCASVTSNLIDGRICLSIKQYGPWQNVFEYQAACSMAGCA